MKGVGKGIKGTGSGRGQHFCQSTIPAVPKISRIFRINTLSLGRNFELPVKMRTPIAFAALLSTLLLQVNVGAHKAELRRV